MSGLIYFTSGKQLEITEREFLRIAPKLKAGGIRLMTMKAGHLVPLNSTTMEIIEYVSEPEEESVSDMVDRGVRALAAEPVLEEQTVAVEKKGKTQEELLAEMKEKSDCKHETHKLELFIQHTAKGIRYFPVCSFCGKRERYVSESKINKGEYAGSLNEHWTDEHIANAKPWIED